MLSVFFIFPVRAKNTFGKKKDKVTRLHFYDLNKNGRMDTYENPLLLWSMCGASFVTDDFGGKGRTDATSLGWPMYERVGEDIRLTLSWRKKSESTISDRSGVFMRLIRGRNVRYIPDSILRWLPERPIVFNLTS